MGTAEDELIGIPFPEHSSELLNSLNEQRHKGLLCDVTIVTQGLEYRTHRAVLAGCSRYFRKLFTSRPFSGQHNVCELDFVRPEVLAALLEFAYTATLTISSSNMREVLQAARLLEIQCVTDACIDILQSSGAPELACADSPADYAKAKQYLDDAAEEAAASPVDVIQTVEVPKFRHRKRPKKLPRVSLNNRRNLYRIIQPLRTSMNNLISGHPAEQLADDSPVRQEDPYPMPLGDQRGSREEEEEAHKDVERNEELGYQPLLPSPVDLRAVAEEEGAELDPASYLNSLSNGILSNSLGLPDKLVRRRKSQMPQECPICRKVIHGAGKLPRHMRTHTGEKPFACEVCGVRFTRNDKLKIHMRKHTGERPYSCDCCDARFLHSYDLKNHARLHTGDRPFECSQCRKAFVRIDHLQRHLKGQNCLEFRTRRRKGDCRPLEEHEVNWEHLRRDGAFPEDYRIRRETPGIDGGFPEDYRIKAESPGIDGSFPEEYGIRRESPGIEGPFPEDYRIKREPPGGEGPLPEKYRMRRESPGGEGPFPEEYRMRRESPGGEGTFPEEYGMSESPGGEGPFPEEYEVRRESPGGEGPFPEEYEVRRESPGGEGPFPEEYEVRRESPGGEGPFPEEYEVRRESPGGEGPFPEEYEVRREPPLTDGKLKADGSQDWGNRSSQWGDQPEEGDLVDPS